MESRGDALRLNRTEESPVRVRLAPSKRRFAGLLRTEGGNDSQLVLVQVAADGLAARLFRIAKTRPARQTPRKGMGEPELADPSQPAAVPRERRKPGRDRHRLPLPRVASPTHLMLA